MHFSEASERSSIWDRYMSLYKPDGSVISNAQVAQERLESRLEKEIEAHEQTKLELQKLKNDGYATLVARLQDSFVQNSKASEAYEKTISEQSKRINELEEKLKARTSEIQNLIENENLKYKEKCEEVKKWEAELRKFGIRKELESPKDSTTPEGQRELDDKKVVDYLYELNETNKNKLAEIQMELDQKTKRLEVVEKVQKEQEKELKTAFRLVVALNIDYEQNQNQITSLQGDLTAANKQIEHQTERIRKLEHMLDKSMTELLKDLSQSKPRRQATPTDGSSKDRKDRLMERLAPLADGSSTSK